MKTYKPSGKFSISSIILLLLSIVTIYPLLGFLYSYITFYIPFIYINFLIAIGFSLIILFINSLIIKFGKVRNILFGAIIGLISVISFLYFSWIVWVDLVGNISDSFGNERIGISISITHIGELFYLLLNPTILLNAILEINKVGTWGIKGTTFSGIVLWIVWLIEAGIFFFFVIFDTIKNVKIPFNENTKTWYEKEIIILNFIEIDKILNEIKNGTLNFISELKKIEKIEGNYIEATLFSSNNNEYYVSLLGKIMYIDKDGKYNFNNSLIIEYLNLSQEQVNLLK